MLPRKRSTLAAHLAHARVFNPRAACLSSLRSRATALLTLRRRAHSFLLLPAHACCLPHLIYCRRFMPRARHIASCVTGTQRAIIGKLNVLMVGSDRLTAHQTHCNSARNA